MRLPQQARDAIRALSSELGSSPLTIADVGARGGAAKRWAALGHGARFLYFEPDQSATVPLGPADHRFVCAIGESNGLRDLRLTRSPGCSSTLLPNEALLANYPDASRFTVVKTIAVETRTLDSVCDAETLRPDVLKIDVQGAALGVLRGAVETLKTVFAIDVETEFIQVYAGQSIFPDVDQWLRAAGFTLVDLNPYWWKRDAGAQTANRRGQLVFADVLYIRDWTTGIGDPKTPRDAAAAILTMLAYGKDDIAVAMTERARTIGLFSQERADQITATLTRRTMSSWLTRLRGRHRVVTLLTRAAGLLGAGNWAASDPEW